MSQSWVLESGEEWEEYEWQSGKSKTKTKTKTKTPKQNKINNTTVKEQYKTKLVGETTRSHIGNLDNKMYYVH